jgi:hypothetical protein
MTKKNTSSEIAREHVPDLDSHYGEIGIPAVAAALRFQSKVENRDAPAQPQPKADKWLADLAA